MTYSRLPCYPLFVNDPYFSIWSKNDTLNAEDTVFWHGEEKPTYGVVKIEGKEYCFLGVKNGAEKLTQTKREITAFSTIYYFENAKFSLKVQFLSALLPNDMLVASCPVCYLRYEVTPKVDVEDIIVELSVEERICYDTCKTYTWFNEDKERKLPIKNDFQPVRLGVLKSEKYQTAFVGLRRQQPLSHANDEVGADWGYYYVVGEYARNDKFGDRQFITAYNVHKGQAKGSLYLAFDDTVSIFYYGQWLKGYFFADGKTIFDAIDFAIANEQSTVEKCVAFDNLLIEETAKYGEEYLYVLRASLRQVMAGHKIVKDNKGRTLFLSKECNSDGCIATVDVSYPTFPMLYKYNKELLKGMLYPILDFARMPVWSYDFAPHDAGVYPYCLGQLYAIKTEDDKDYGQTLEGACELLPMYYLFPKGNDIYNFERQMPVEESANMIILLALSGDLKLKEENFDLLSKWVKYLVEKGLLPENQLCTDDFAGHLDKNANLAIKAIMGIKAYAEIAKELKKIDVFEEYISIAKNYAKSWLDLYVVNGKSVLNLGSEDTFSLKYNLAIDRLIGEKLFSCEFKEREVDLYLEKSNRYGTPLDTRKDYTKADWLIWSATLTEDINKRKEIISWIANFLRETPDRVPFSDWYETVNAKYCMFRNRTVLGGLFMLLI